MEEAYNELYRQFLLLRSLCLRQAGLLHQLTTALQKQQGASVTNGKLNDTSYILVQCTNEIPECLSQKPLTTGVQHPAALCNMDHPSRDAGTVSGLLDENMSKLSVETSCQRKQDVKTEKINPFFLTWDSCVRPEASSSQTKTNPHAEGGASYTVKMPVTNSPPAAGDLVHQSGGQLMSEITLQSHVCEFCQAVFPGDTTTGGEFLRHLYTHVT